MTTSIYTNRFKRKRSSNKKRTSSHEPPQKFQTDKQAYVKFLEGHLDKLTNSVNAIDGFT